jgi:hypothetical protein
MASSLPITLYKFEKLKASMYKGNTPVKNTALLKN